MKTLRRLAVSFLAPLLFAAPAPERIAELSRELEAMLETDQAQRGKMATVEKEHGAASPQLAELWRQQSAADTHNIARLEEIIAEVGWPGRSVVGPQAARAAFLILQHADLRYQQKHLPLARAAVAAGEMAPSSLALLEDRIRVREGNKQLYGSQVQRNEAGEWDALPLEDPAGVDQRRAALGLGPLADYLAGFAQRNGGRVADRRADAPAADAPPLRQTLFAPGDDARAAYDKLRAARPASAADTLAYQLACHDFVQRFPGHGLYGAVRILAVHALGFWRDADPGKLPVWDPPEADRDPRLDPEQRAEAALVLAGHNAADPMRTGGAGWAGWAEAHFDAIVAALPPHRETRYARDHVIRVALEAPPARAIPALRALYPDEPAVAACLRALEQIGQPCELAFTSCDGRPFDLRDHRGRVVLIVGWSNQGDSTTRFLPQLRALAERHGPENLAIVGVSFDRTREALQEGITRHALDWPIAFDGLGWSNAIATRFLIKVLPAYLLVDREGVLRHRGVQPASAAALAQITRLLAEPARRPATEKTSAAPPPR